MGEEEIADLLKLGAVKIRQKTPRESKMEDALKLEQDGEIVND